MKRTIVFIVISLLAGVGGTASTPLSTDQTNALTTIDEVPTQQQLSTAFGSGAPAAIAQVADDDGNVVGIRLRAIRSIATFCQPPTTCDTSSAPHAALANIIADPAYATAPGGSNLLILRASIESLGQLKQTGDASILIGFLDHPSRDVRATTAFALRDLCNSQVAVPALHTRLQHEATAQVQLAISAALRALSQSPCI
jgi:HEAT repeat protein